MGKYTAYRIRCLASGLSYIGVTSRTLERRFSDHRQAAAKGKGGRLYEAMREHGEHAFHIIKVGEAETPAEIGQLEDRLILECQTLWPGGYNMKRGGQGGALSAETRERLRQLNLGKKASEETRAKMRATRKGSPGPGAALQALAAASRRGVRLTDDHKKRLSEVALGRVWSTESREKLSAARKGRKSAPWTDERRANVKAAQHARRERERLAKATTA